MVKIINNLKILLNGNKCALKYSAGEFTHKNIGDALNVYLFEKVFGKEVESYKNLLNVGVPQVYSFIGSVLDNTAVRNLVVMGSGFKSATSKVPVVPKKVIACRGPLTRKKLMDHQLEVPEVYGDPAILLPFFYNPEVTKKYRIGFIPHYSEMDLEIVKYWKEKPDVKYIDVFSKMEDFIQDIKSCDFTISSSLHGVILSHAYGVPSGWIKLSDTLVGGSFKFDDYFNSLNTSFKPMSLERSSKIVDLQPQTTLPETNSLAENLLETFNSAKVF
ncbi:pyruvyltransferase [Salegentibacter echinorum]|uniref:Pyruvyltransferase n=1 Tax=Salegentibacter echinorum TaxID=1073325 RepID=A0A1M5FGV3_SALEC|nr:polysaccharide pyruvyl transferase family protein [Salegentibacter echinorum]SHF90780.1 pyruvyltransferase [Salegentibacter echinorum]